MAQELCSGRTPNQVKNRWATRISESPDLAEASARAKLCRNRATFERIFATVQCEIATGQSPFSQSDDASNRPMAFP
jgi:hypothetical protein